MAQAQQNTQEKKGNSRKGLIIAFVIMLLAINSVQLYFNLTQDKKIEEQTVTITNQTKKYDSLSTVFDGKIKELKDLESKLTAMGVETDSLKSLISQLETDRDKYKRDAGVYYKKYKDIQNSIDAANRERDKYMAQVEEMKALLAKQDTIIQDKNSQITIQQQTIVKMEENEKDLQHKVAIASVLRAEGFTVQALSAKGKVKEGAEFKAKSIDMIKIQFSLGENKVAPKGPRDVYMRLIEPDGSVIVNTETGGGSFKDANGKDLPFTSKTNVTYMNNNQKVTFDFKKGAAYKPGKHRVEIYVEGVMIGESTFTVTK